ncbi:copia protein [Tanacetum coccineum]
MSDESPVIPLEELRVDDKLHFVEEPVEVMDREIKQLKRSLIPIIKVRWNSKRGPEFTWEREDQFKQKYPHLFTKTAPSDSPFDLEVFSDSDYVGASLDKKSTTGGCQLFGKRLISWQCKRQTIVANSTTKAEYVAAANCCGQFEDSISNEFGVKTGGCKVNATRQDLFVDQHNMVDCLEKSKGNADFHEIVDFLIASSVHYALTVSPTIYASYIEQFWNTAHSQTVNDVKQIHATVDGKTIVISESSVRSDLYFNDEDGITYLTNAAIFENLALMGYESDSNKLTFQKALFSPQWKYLIHTILHCLSSKSTSWNEFSTNIASAVICLANGQKFNFSKLIFDEPFNDVYQTPAHTKKVFTNMKRKGKAFLGIVTPLFASMLAPPVVESEGSGQPSKPQPAPSTAQLRIKEQILTSVPIPNVADEAVFKKRDDRVVRATTTAASLDAAQASGNISKTQSTTMFNDPLSQEISLGDKPRCQEAIGGVIAQTQSERSSKHSYDLPLQGGNKPGSDEERIEQDDLTEFVPPTPHDSPLSGGYTPGSDKGEESDKTKPLAELDVDNVMENVEGDAETQGRNTVEQTTTAGDTVNTASIDVSVTRPLNVSTVDPSTSTAGDIFKDEMMTIADTLMAIRSTRPRTTSIVIRDVKEEPRRATSIPTVQSQDKGKGKMVELEPTLKNPIKAQIQRDAEIAQSLFEEDQTQFEREQRIARERATKQKAKDATLIEQMEDIQARMDVDKLLAE